MASGRRATRSPEAPTTGAPPPLRDRLLVIDDFLPAELAGAMRRDIDDHFANPGAHAAPTHQVWNYWFVPELYAYLRTQPEKVIAPASAHRCFEAVRDWSTLTLGLSHVTWPYLSLYVAGCRQNLHNDSVGGRFGYVYSLTRNERRTVGGETIVHREGDAFRALRAQPGAGRSFYDAIEPRFNRLVVFDDRMPHAVEPMAGSMDPLEGRFVLHGHISEGPAAVSGALARDVALPPAVEAIKEFTEARFLDGYHGPLTVRLEVLPDGSVGDCRALLDRVIHPDAQDRRWPALADEVLARLRATRFPEASGPTTLLLPVILGAQLGDPPSGG